MKKFSQILFIQFNIYYFWLTGSSCCMRAFSGFGELGVLSSYGAGVLAVVFYCTAQVLRVWASVVVAHRLQSTGSVLVVLGLVASCHVRPSQTRDRTGIPCSQGRFLTTGPPGKPQLVFNGHCTICTCCLQRKDILIILSSLT